MERFLELNRRGELNTSVKQYEYVQDFYKSLNSFLNNNALIRTYHEKYLCKSNSEKTSPNQNVDKNQELLLNIQNTEEIEKLIEAIMIFVESVVSTNIYDIVFPLIMTEFEDNDINIQKRIRSFYWITSDMIGTCLDENSILYRDFYEESLSRNEI